MASQDSGTAAVASQEEVPYIAIFFSVRLRESSQSSNMPSPQLPPPCDHSLLVRNATVMELRHECMRVKVFAMAISWSPTKTWSGYS